MRKNASCLFNAMLIFFNIKMVPVLSFKKILVCTVCGQELVKKKKKKHKHVLLNNKVNNLDFKN